MALVACKSNQATNTVHETVSSHLIKMLQYDCAWQTHQVSFTAPSLPWMSNPSSNTHVLGWTGCKKHRASSINTHQASSKFQFPRLISRLLFEFNRFRDLTYLLEQTICGYNDASIGPDDSILDLSKGFFTLLNIFKGNNWNMMIIIESSCCKYHEHTFPSWLYTPHFWFDHLNISSTTKGCCSV